MIHTINTLPLRQSFSVKSQVHKSIAVILLAVFSVYLIPKELVHAMYGHHDTVDVVVDAHAGKAIGKHHLHCDFLFFEASLFTVTSTAACPFAGEHAFAFLLTPVEQPAICPTLFPSLRGPPHC